MCFTVHFTDDFLSAFFDYVVLLAMTMTMDIWIDRGMVNTYHYILCNQLAPFN